MNPLAVEFEIASSERFELLRCVFEALRSAKASDAFTDEHSGWLAYFDEAARATFWWPTEQDIEAWQRRWDATPPHLRIHDPTLHTRWGFESMIEAFRNGEYDLGVCERLSESTGRLTFFEHAFPFGGSGCMRALIEAFGHRVTRDYDGSAPPPTAEGW